MANEKGSLEKIIIREIEQKGPIPFRDFMEMSLYYPDLGYYTSENRRIGTNGDYYTSPWLSSVLGEMLALQIEEMWAILGKEDFTIVEFGGGDGTLCIDILNQLKNNPVLYSRLRYHIIEKKRRLREEDKKQVPGIQSWHESPDEIGPVKNGCVLSNELLDNLSTSPVVMQDELMEVFVDYNDGFVETLRPAGSKLKQYFAQLGVRLPNGFRTEVNLEAIEWIRKVAAILEKGFVLTIDYGCPSAELYSTTRSEGTLVCYHRHQVNYSPYQHIGEQDITTHVNFSALQHWGIQNGLECCGFTSQANFLLGLGLTSHLQQKEIKSTMKSLPPSRKAMMIHTFLAGMGRKFKVLIQNKGLQKPRLSGLQFSLPYF